MNPTRVITAIGEVQTHEEATVYVKELDIFLTMKVLVKTDILMNESMVKNHISLKTGIGFPATRKTSFLLWFQACEVRLQDRHQLQGHLHDRRVTAHHLLENERINLRMTSFEYLCQQRLMKDCVI